MRRLFAALLLASCLALLAGTTAAQDIAPKPSVGVKVGVNSSNLQVTGDGTSNRTGFVVAHYSALDSRETVNHQGNPHRVTGV